MKKLLLSCVTLAVLLSACGQEPSGGNQPAAQPALSPMPGARPFKQEALPAPNKEAFSKSMAEADARAAKQGTAATASNPQ